PASASLCTLHPFPTRRSSDLATAGTPAHRRALSACLLRGSGMSTSANGNGGAREPELVPLPLETTRRDFAVTGIFIILAIYALYFGREFFMPVILACLLALTLTPIVRFARKRGIPSAISATLLVLATSGVIGLGGYLLSGPVMQLVSDAPSIGRTLT